MSSVRLSGNAGGTGIFTIASPNSNSSPTMTLPDNTGTIITTASTFAGTGPAFSAYQSSAQTLSSTTYTKIQLQTEEFDTANCFDSTTNYRFTPNVAGYYQISGGTCIISPSSVYQTIIYKNGSAFKFIGNAAIDATRGQWGSALIYFNGTTDYVELYAYLSTGQALNATSALVYFQGFLARAA
jgi:hypothetical protein